MRSGNGIFAKREVKEWDKDLNWDKRVAGKGRKAGLGGKREKA